MVRLANFERPRLEQNPGPGGVRVDDEHRAFRFLLPKFQQWMDAFPPPMEPHLDFSSLRAGRNHPCLRLTSSAAKPDCARRTMLPRCRHST